MRRNKIVYGSMALVILFSLNVIPRISLSEEPETVLSEASILDASYLDKILDYSDTIKLPVIGVEELPVLDAALDTFDELSPIDFELGFTLANAYIWRGQTLGGDASFQPYVTVSPSFEPIGDLSFTFWADITKDESGENQREYDFVVDYNFDVLDLLSGIGYSEDDAPHVLTKLLDFNFDTGYIYYKFPPQPDTKSQEVYFGVEYDLPLHPSFFVYNDWNRGRGAWLAWGISQDVNIGVCTLSNYATLNYNHGQWGADSQFSTLDFGTSIPISIGKHMTIEPFISYTKELDDDGADMVNDELYGGFNWSINF